MNLSYLDQLNEPQRHAVERQDGPIMIIAGAGSGKTRVLTYRIAHLINSGVDAFRILSLTFTNKAAREMRNRIESVAGPESRNLWMGTFHAVFAKVLRIEAEKLGYPTNFVIYDTDDAKSVVKDILKENNLDDKTYKPETVLSRISAAKNNLYTWQEYQANIDFVNEDHASRKPLMGKLFELYVKRCFKNGAMDFDDLIVNMYRLLVEFKDLKHKYATKFRYIMVDEFQDTNYAQYQVLKKLASIHQNICVVGDDAQSIYAFRGANIQNILNFEKDYPDLNVFKLEQNYRSTNTIVQAANNVIANNKYQLKKSVWTSNNPGSKISLVKALTDNEEGAQVAQNIFEQKMNNQWHNNEFAILYRTNAQSRAMEEALRKKGIAYRIYGGLSFYKRKEIKDLLAFFRLTINQQDDEALKRIINIPARGIGKTTLDKLSVLAAGSAFSIWQLILDGSVKNEFNNPTWQRLVDFCTMIQSFQIKLRSDNAFELGSHIATHTGLVRELYADKTPEGVSRYENIQELLNGMKEFVESGRSITPLGDENAFEDTGEIRTLDMFMQDISLLTDADDEDKETDTVTLMTVHAAKGLEFKSVFVVGLEENLFPSALSINSREELEEERRLFYVAMTRAEHKLTISYANQRFRWGNLVSNDPSRFIEEINPDLIEESAAKSFSRQNPFANQQDLPDRWHQQPSKTFVSQFAPKQNSKPLAPPVGFKKISTQTTYDTGSVLETVNIGDTVEHARFGIGKIVLLEGKDADQKVTINFEGVGNKVLLLKFAKLKPIAQ
ncbi:MAG: hypothetical protein RIQ89_1480 [Bacteroidota bacterium]|jgi:DNA helicase-2/ATP-dependent DNA helicase PcrA